MKKILIPLLCISLLTGCEITFADEIKEPEPTETEPQDNTPNNNDDGGSNQNQGDNSQGNEQGGDNNNQDQQNDVLKKKITFTDGTFVGQLDQQPTRETFVSYVNGDDNLLSSVSMEGKSESKSTEFGRIENGEVKKESHVLWWIGSAAYNGVLTMNFNVDVVGIKLSIQAYYKTFVNTWSQEDPVVIKNIDTTSKLYIDSTDYVKDLSCDEDSTPEVVDFSKEYTVPTKQITIGNFQEEARVYIHSMEIQYKKNLA